MKLKELKRSLLEKAEKEARFDRADLEVRLVVSNTLSLSPIDQIMNSDKELSDTDVAKCFSMLEKRISGYPEAYLSGRKEFYGRSFLVNEKVLIPRPDTETLVECALEIASGMSEDLEILDLCTGSGCIGTTLKAELPDARVYLSDISPEALEVAKRNFLIITGENADARLGDLFAPWEGKLFDMIATNPPYVTEQWYSEVSPEVKKEPAIALIDHASDGLDIIRRIIKEAGEHLKPSGALLIEADYRQAEAIRNLLADSGYKDIRTERDLAGKERCSIAFL